jgi:hypothetical protein
MIIWISFLGLGIDFGILGFRKLKQIVHNHCTYVYEGAD